MSRVQMGFATVMHMKESCRTMNTDRDGGGTMDRKELAVALLQLGACVASSRVAVCCACRTVLQFRLVLCCSRCVC